MTARTFPIEFAQLALVDLTGILPRLCGDKFLYLGNLVVGHVLTQIGSHTVHRQIRAGFEESMCTQEFAKLLIGNKSDVPDQDRVVDFSEGKQIA